jgi:hypothetical protein
MKFIAERAARGAVRCQGSSHPSIGRVAGIRHGTLHHVPYTTGFCFNRNSSQACIPSPALADSSKICA